MIDKYTVQIHSGDFWFKIVEMLQQYWALIEEVGAALHRNGFERYEEDAESQKFIAPPRPPFWKAKHSNGPIYSSGRFWR